MDTPVTIHTPIPAEDVFYLLPYLAVLVCPGQCFSLVEVTALRYASRRNQLVEGIVCSKGIDHNGFLPICHLFLRIDAQAFFSSSAALFRISISSCRERTCF